MIGWSTFPSLGSLIIFLLLTIAGVGSLACYQLVSQFRQGAPAPVTKPTYRLALLPSPGPVPTRASLDLTAGSTACQLNSAPPLAAEPANRHENQSLKLSWPPIPSPVANSVTIGRTGSGPSNPPAIPAVNTPLPQAMPAASQKIVSPTPLPSATPLANPTPSPTLTPVPDYDFMLAEFFNSPTTNHFLMVHVAVVDPREIPIGDMKVVGIRLDNNLTMKHP